MKTDLRCVRGPVVCFLVIFTFAQAIFHSEAIALGSAKFHSLLANFTEKSQVIRLGFFHGAGRETRTLDLPHVKRML